ncbi:MAG: protein BatD [bacterium]|nr:protein BatD [bacterium]
MLRALLLLMVLVQFAVAQVKVTATANRTILPAGEMVEVTIAVEGAATGVPTPQLSDVTNLDLVGGPSTSTQTSIVNGRVTSQKSYTYFFRAKAAGTAIVGPISLNIKGKPYTTSPLSLTITPTGQKGRTGEREEVFIQVIPDKRQAYVGEQIVLTYKLFFSTTIYAPEFKELPKSTGFWTEEFDMPSQLVPRDEVVDGSNYKSVVIRKVAVFAATAGELTIEPLTAVVQVERRANQRGRSNDPFNDPFFNFGRRREQVEVTCRQLSLDIKPLPEVGRPAGEVAVGNYSITAKLDKVQAATNDAVTLTVQVRGAGNIKMLPSPRVTIPPDFEAFDPKVTDQLKRGPDKISGTKTLEYVLIPRVAGAQAIPAIELPYFDLANEKYGVARTQELTLSVVRGTGSGSAGALPFAGKREVQSVGQDIAYVKNSVGTLAPVGELPHQSMAFWLGLSGPWLILAGVLFAVRRQEQVSRTLSGRRRRILRSVRLELDAADKANQQGKTEVVTRTLENVVRSVAMEWTGLHTATATAQEWEAEWNARGLPSEQWTVLSGALTLSERNRYAGGALSRSDLTDLIAKLRTVTQELEGVQ